jgi:hypothetical protein
VRRVTRWILTLVTAVVTYYIAYIAVSFAWFGITGANFLIGPSEFGGPSEIIFHLGTTAVAAAAAGLVAGGILTRSWAITRLVAGGTVVLTAAFIVFFTLVFDRDPTQSPVHALVAAVAAVLLGGTLSRRPRN